MKIQKKAENNIFFIDFETDRKRRKELAEIIIDSYSISGFWLGSIPIPFLDKKLLQNSRGNMINMIIGIYKLVIEKEKYEKNGSQLLGVLANTTSNIFTTSGIVGTTMITFNPLLSILSLPLGISVGSAIAFVKGITSQKETKKIGEKLIKELDGKYAEINIIDKYDNLANQLINNSNKLERFPNMIKDKWYDVSIHKGT